MDALFIAYAFFIAVLGVGALIVYGLIKFIVAVIEHYSKKDSNAENN